MYDNDDDNAEVENQSALESILLCAEVRRYLDGMYGIHVWEDVHREGDKTVVTVRDGYVLEMLLPLFGDDPRIIVKLEVQS